MRNDVISLPCNYHHLTLHPICLYLCLCPRMDVSQVLAFMESGVMTVCNFELTKVSYHALLCSTQSNCSASLRFSKILSLRSQVM